MEEASEAASPGFRLGLRPLTTLCGGFFNMKQEW